MKQVECHICGKKSNIFTRYFYKTDIVIEYIKDGSKLVYNCPKCNKEINKTFDKVFNMKERR